MFGLNKKLLGETKYSLVDFCREVKAPIEGLGVINGYQIEVERGGYLLFKRTEKTNEFEILEEKQ